MNQSKIKTYPSIEFKEKFILNNEQSALQIGKGFGVFFILKVEDMLPLMKLPVPALRVTTHSFIFITEGTANISVGTEHYIIKKNEGIFVPEGQVFSFDNYDINKGYFCNFHSDFIISQITKSDITRNFDFLNKWGNPKVNLAKSHQYCLQLLKRLDQEYHQNCLDRKTILQSYLLALLCEIDAEYQEVNPTLSGRPMELSSRFKLLLDEHIRSMHAVSEYAAMLHVSPNHLNKVLKKTTNKTTKSWIQETLILEAKVLLCQTQLSVNEISAELGILDPSYFNRLFKKATNFSPLSYRKMIEKS